MPIRVENYEIIDLSHDPSPFDDWVHVISEDTSYSKG